MAQSILSCAACLRRAVQGFPRGRTLPESYALLDDSPLRLARRQYSSLRAAVVDAPQALGVQPLDPTASEKKERERLQRIVKKHMERMDDPWHIAQYVDQTLAKGRYDEALLLTQQASKDRQVVVAWNSLINYQLEHQQLKKAIKLFNDMKKRSQLPNVQTFTVLFRGLAKSNHPKLAVAEATKHYNILINDGRLQPNSIHLNAVLNVCAKAGDLEQMFLIADTVNDSARAPDSYTYTTIFNALRHHALNDLKDLADMPSEQRAANVDKTVDRAKGLWTEVMDKWTAGRLVIDEELVCSMGRLLLLSPQRERKQEVLDLLQQTMSIPNLSKSSEAEPQLDSEMQNIAVSGPSKSVPATRAVYAVPGRNALSLLLTTLASARLTTCGIKYWNLMVRHYGIAPDSDNWLRMFGMLKVAKASAHAASILEIMPDEYVGPKPYRMAMETCVRDNINPNVSKNSTAVLESMQKRLEVPDLQALRLYLRVALVSHHGLRAKSRSGEADAAKRAYGVQITKALSRLWEPYKKTHYHYFKASRPNGKEEEAILYNDKREVIALARLMSSAFSKVIEERMLPENDLREMRPIGAKINREIQKFYAERETHEPNLRDASGSSSAEDAPDQEAEEGGQDATGYLSGRSGAGFIWDTTFRAAREVPGERRDAGEGMRSRRAPRDSSSWRTGASEGPDSHRASREDFRRQRPAGERPDVHWDR